ncbi:MAG: hypothetical protein IJP23_01495 [Oscillospiraceae bacterium]|nr:hypothetical protein [Oscillospiraceae bacterium]
MDKKPKRRPAIVGGSSILVIFAVLCLTVFALLSVSTAKAGEAISSGAADAVEGYYAADCAAEEILARLRSGEEPENVKNEGGGVYSYTCTVSKTQELAVKVALDGGNYKILRWQLIPSGQWQADDSLPVWSGE